MKVTLERFNPITTKWSKQVFKSYVNRNFNFKWYFNKCVIIKNEQKRFDGLTRNLLFNQEFISEFPNICSRPNSGIIHNFRTRIHGYWLSEAPSAPNLLQIARPARGSKQEVPRGEMKLAGTAPQICVNGRIQGYSIRWKHSRALAKLQYSTDISKSLERWNYI